MPITQTKSRHQVAMTASSMSGEGGIRTPGPLSETQHFQCCTIGRSVTSPRHGRQQDAVAVKQSQLLASLGSTVSVFCRTSWP